ncbi:hypothetical protein [Pleionea sp. CnH1-48]|uniref:hypothetical protein n=1 Tax=Pleionea sp. CnH1-48 TaxID=2954494 RepID=UPI0020981E44|nr:hypothetical protein [Pleionea sp. CnH1-48]MCO7226287.1 hypothetical protein [Pleionea sp. CnH1-48]
MNTDARVLLNWADTLIVVGLLGTLLSTIAAYFADQHLTLAQQIAAHLGILLFPSVLKLAYVARLNAMKHLNYWT